MEIEPYVKIWMTRHPIINGKTVYDQKELVWEIDIPRRIYEARIDTFDWIRSRFKYFNPKYHISTSHHYYDKKTGIDLAWNSAYTKWVAAKGQVTKMKNKMEEYVRNFEPNLYEQDPYTMPAYLRALEKLKEKEANLEHAERELEKAKQESATAN